MDRQVQALGRPPSIRESDLARTGHRRILPRGWGFRIGPCSSSRFVACADLVIAQTHMMVTQVVTIRKLSPGSLREYDLMIQIPVFLEILTSCFTGLAEVWLA